MINSSTVPGKMAAFLIPLLLSFTLFQKPNIQVYMIGDSTMCSYEAQYAPVTGWGMPFSHFFDSTVTVRNEAKSGRSTKTFIDENLWQPIAANLRPGDYVFIQFGHNDEVPSKKSSTPVKDFRANLIRFISETRAKGAFPLLFTPVARRSFDDSGRIRETHGEYSAVVLNVAAQYKVPCIDLNGKAQKLYQSLGPENSKFYFNYLAAGENPHYPNGNIDDTHFNELGARIIAELALAGIRDLKLELADRVFKPQE
jgi:lysophospholipase L1-like esterase